MTRYRFIAESGLTLEARALLDATRPPDMLSQDDVSIQRVAAAVGFASADVFRRAFERRFAFAHGLSRAVCALIHDRARCAPVLG